MKKEKNTTENFEEALARLEQIVTLLENGKSSLDDSLIAFEEGIALVKYCNEKLERAEQKISILTGTVDGGMEEMPFVGGDAQ